MKKILVFFALLGLFASAIFAFYAFNLFIYNEKQGNNEITVPHNTFDERVKSLTDESEVLIAAIKNELVAKHGSDIATLNVNVSEFSGMYAKGEVGEAGTGGGIWFAVKVNGLWQLIFDGNGIILCSDLEQYPEFPSSLIPQCFDDANNTLIKR